MIVAKKKMMMSQLDSYHSFIGPFIVIHSHYSHMITSFGGTIHFSITVTRMPSTKPTAKAITIAFMSIDLCFFISQI